MSTPHRPNSPGPGPQITAISTDGLRRLADAVDAFHPGAAEGGLPDGPDKDRPFGRFLLGEVLGRGKFGIVFRAEDPQTGRTVALKLPQPSVLIDPALGERFLRDAEAAGPLDHPGIVPILEAGAVGPVPYLALPLIDGPTLHTWLARHPGPAPVADAIDLAIALADAVQYAHERGVLHCDLKPANVLLAPRQPGCADGPLAGLQPRITDFGLARLLFRDPQETQTHLTAGTPPYMAPEQALGERRHLTARCDVHALAAILYELLTGQPPYADSGDSERLRSLLDPEVRPAPPRSLRPGLPRDLEAIAMRGLEKSPEARYASARDLADDLRRFREGRPTLARPVGPLTQAWRWARRRPVVAATLLSFASLAALTAWLASREVSHRHELDLATQASELNELHALLERVRQRRVERPDGWGDDNLNDLRQLAAQPAAGAFQADLCSEAAQALAAPRLRRVRALAPGTNAYVAAFSPDGRTVALGEQYPILDGQLRVWLVDPQTGRVKEELRYPVDSAWEMDRRNTRADGSRSILYSPDGKWLVVGTRGGRLVRWDLADREPRAVAWQAAPHTPDHAHHEVRSLVFNEDGTVLLAGSVGLSISRWDVRQGWARAEVEGGLLPMGTPTAREQTWLYTPWNDLVFRQLDLRTGQSLPPLPAPQVAPFCVGLGGDVIVTESSGEGPECWQMSPASAGYRRPLLVSSLAREYQSIKDLAFTPDSRWLFTGSARRGVIDMWDTVSGWRVTGGALKGGSARLAVGPTGQYLATCEMGRTSLFEVGPGPVHRAAVCEPGEVGTFALSPDGQRLVTFLINRLPRRGKTEDPLWYYSRRALYHREATGFACREVVHIPTTGVHGLQVAFTPWPNGWSLTNSESRNLTPGLATSQGGWLPGDPIDDVQWGPGGAWIAMAGKLLRWPGHGAAETLFTPDPEDERAGAMFTVLFAGDGEVFGGRADGRVLRFDRAGRLLATWSIFTDQKVSSLALAPDGALLVGGSDGALARAHLSSGEIFRPSEEPHRKAVTGIACFRDGTTLTGSADGMIRFWDKRGQPLMTLRGTGPIAKLVLGPGGRELFVQVKGEWGVRVWDLAALHAGLRDLGLSPRWPAPDAPACPPPPAEAHGLRAELFDDAAHTWLAHRRIDDGIDLNSPDQAPSPWVSPGAFSARWTGYLRAPRPGRWEVQLDHDGPVTGWLDGRPAFNAPTGDEGPSHSTWDLPAGPVSFRLDYARGKTSRCRLLWRPAETGLPFAPVPREAFTPDRPAAGARAD